MTADPAMQADLRTMSARLGRTEHQLALLLIDFEKYYLALNETIAMQKVIRETLNTVLAALDMTPPEPPPPTVHSIPPIPEKI